LSVVAAEEEPVRHRWSAPLLAALVLLGAACAEDDVDPAEARAERVEQRLQDSFSAAQARCIVGRVDDTVVRALDRTADLAADDEALAAYSEAVAACVADPTATAPTSTSAPASPDTSTTAPG
jgi:hypothetical protein